MTDEIRDEDDFIPTNSMNDGPNPGDRIVYLLERLVEGQNGYPSMTESVLRLDRDVVVGSRNRMRVNHVIISGDAGQAIIVDLLVGTAAYTFTVQAGGDNFPFPLVVENGVDLTFRTNGSGGENPDGPMYLIYTSE